VTLSTLSSETKFLLAIVTAVLCVIIGLGLFNFSNDRWGIYSQDRLYFVEDIQPNRFALKTWHVLDNPEKYDCLLMGSSRVEMIDTTKMPGNCYNFTHSGAIPGNHKAALELFLEAGIRFETVYIGLDEASYLQDPDKGLEQNLRRTPPRNILEWLNFHASYLLHFPQIRDWEIFNGYSPMLKNVWYVLKPESHLLELRKEAESFFLPSEENKNRMSRKQGIHWGHENYVQEAIEDLGAVASLAEEYGFDLVFFFNPLYQKTYLQQDVYVLNQFLRGVTEKADILDFSGLNEYTLDDRYWHEASHFSTRLGDLMLPSITSGIQKNGRFGFILSRENIERSLRRKYRLDTASLLQSPIFKGANFVPEYLAERITSRRESPWQEYNHVDIELSKLERFGSTYASDGPGSSLKFPGLCPPEGSVILLRLDLEYYKPARLFAYTPLESDQNSNQRRSRKFIPAGRQNLYILIRDIDCGTDLRLDPVSARNHFKIHGVSFLEVAKRLQKSQ
jgi:hypothetical protein